MVEYAYSLELLLSILGGAVWRPAGKVTFNALPATFSPDMWAHQYDQQVNQVECSSQLGRTWNTNGPEANVGAGAELRLLYGESQPRLAEFAAHLWMRKQESGLAAVAYAPSIVS